MSSLTHTLTHTGKSPYGISETRSTRKDVEGEGKGMKMPLHRHLKGLGTFRNQQVACSSHVTSSKNPRKQAVYGDFFYLDVGAVGP